MGQAQRDMTLDGDLGQMASQKSFLRSRGFDIGQVDVYPVIKKDDVVEALTAIWQTKTDGWWHYLDQYVEFGICTKKQYQDGFGS